jgi:hypothetical protein
MISFTIRCMVGTFFSMAISNRSLVFHANPATKGETNHATTFSTVTPFESATKIVLFSVME